MILTIGKYEGDRIVLMKNRGHGLHVRMLRMGRQLRLERLDTAVKMHRSYSSCTSLPSLTTKPFLTTQIDYRSFLNKLWPAMPADEFIQMASDPKVLGNPLLKTQHFIGGTKWEKVSEDEIIGWHQLRVPHQKYTDATMTEVAVNGHAHSTNQHWYKKIDGEWKFAGLNPEIRWSEFDFDKVFEEGREELGEKNEEKIEAKVDAKVEEKVEEKFSEKAEQKVEVKEVIPVLA